MPTLIPRQRTGHLSNSRPRCCAASDAPPSAARQLLWDTHLFTKAPSKKSQLLGLHPAGNPRDTCPQAPSSTSLCTQHLVHTCPGPAVASASGLRFGAGATHPP